MRRAAKTDGNHGQIRDHLRVTLLASDFVFAPMLERLPPRGRVTKNCVECSKPFTIKASAADKRQRCSKECLGKYLAREALGAKNPNFRYHTNATCEGCERRFKRYTPNRRFCSVACSHVWQLLQGRIQSEMRLASKKDENQDEIVAGLEAGGVSVLTVCGLGHGVPDLIAATKAKTALLEVKNPQSAYGKRGLNPLQAAFAKQWRGELYIVTTVDEALIAMGVKDCPEGQLPPVDYGWGDFVARTKKEGRS